MPSSLLHSIIAIYLLHVQFPLKLSDSSTTFFTDVLLPVYSLICPDPKARFNTFFTDVLLSVFSPFYLDPKAQFNTFFTDVLLSVYSPMYPDPKAMFNTLQLPQKTTQLLQNPPLLARYERNSPRSLCVLMSSSNASHFFCGCQ